MLPQRDGFEFNVEWQQVLMKDVFPNDEERSKALSWVIYLTDIGKFVYESDVVIANMDEPLDPGVIVECMVAKEMGKPVIQYRTDCRSPYGGMGDCHKGMHWFPMFPADHFIFMPPLMFGTAKHVSNFYEACTEELDRACQEVKEKSLAQNDEDMTQHAKEIVRLAKMILEGAPDLTSPGALKRILKNYVEMKDELEAFAPKMKYRMSY